MDWWEALLLGLIQGLTEFLPVSSSGHLMVVKELMGVDGDGFLDFTIAVHFATVLSTIIVFWKPIVALFKGLLKFKYNYETDYVVKIIVSTIPIAVVGFAFKDAIENLFANSLTVVGVCLLVTAALLFFSDRLSKKSDASVGAENNWTRSGINFCQAFCVGLGQALAVFPGLSRSGTTIATGLICGVKREAMAQFSFLMVLVPIVGEQLLSLLDVFRSDLPLGGGLGLMPILLGFLAAFFSGLLACRTMIALVKKAKLGWFSLYCVVAAVLILILL